VKLARLRVRLVTVPLRIAFEHAARSRKHTRNVIVEVVLADGTTGFGEGVPREYVTGESAQDAFQALCDARFTDIAGGFAGFDELVQFLGGCEPAPIGNAAWCALELALLDAFGRSFNRPVSDAASIVLPAHMIDPRPRARYDAVISAGTSRRRTCRALLYHLFGFRRMKFKVGLDDDDDVRALAAVRRLVGSGVDLRVDANGAWDLERAAGMCERLAPFGISCVEQPLPAGSEDQLPQLRRRTDLPIMLDESLTSLESARRAIERGWCDVFNIRISKLGGFVAAAKTAELARRAGLAYALGCQVGETAILSAAGRHFATTVGGIRYVEGSYDRFLLAGNVTRKPVSFGWGGFARTISGPGLGITIHAPALEAMTDCVRCIEL